MSRIGELLLKHGIVTEEQLNEALNLQETTKKRLGEILVELGYVGSDDLLWMLSEQANIPFVEIQPEMLDAHLIRKFPRDLLHQHRVLPLHESETRIYVAVGDPTNTAAIECIKQIACKKVVASGATPEKIKQLLDEFYRGHGQQEVKTTLIRIRSENATIEFTDRLGRKRRKSTPLEIIIRTKDKKGGTIDA
jgi:transcriptional antiterminator